MTRLLLLIFALATLATAAQAAEIKGRARVIDGDTLWVGKIKIRLNGIDAPERGKARYRAATQALQKLVAGKIVVCHLNGDKTYDRYVGICYVGEHDLAASVIATGNALDCARYSGGRYRKFETKDARRYIRQAPYC
ncbi:thermonuclease family protein [Aliiroseovarius marinus]|uniref:thermonuclease family protein n=1 Tax=Aliiroseovarius marinus TaxID=2500159 RepID=UPI00105FB701|nr:thermonuclease family protein [Aliiroseovarius marinus]